MGIRPSFDDGNAPSIGRLFDFDDNIYKLIHVKFIFCVMKSSLTDFRLDNKSKKIKKKPEISPMEFNRRLPT